MVGSSRRGQPNRCLDHAGARCWRAGISPKRGPLSLARAIIGCTGSRLRVRAGRLVPQQLLGGREPAHPGANYGQAGKPFKTSSTTLYWRECEQKVPNASDVAVRAPAEAGWIGTNSHARSLDAKMICERDVSCRFSLGLRPSPVC
jgi:hypothetical protein